MDDLIQRQAVDTLVDELARAISDERSCMSRGRSTATIMQNILDLPSVKPQICEDAISRQAVIDAIYDMEILKYRIDLENVIKALPSVKPQEKTGHWKLQPSNKEQGERDFIWWKCSKCGQVIFSETEKDRREYHAFCGRCGAKMVEEQESEVKHG